MSKIIVDSGVTDEAHPELFDTRVMLPQPKDKKPGQISDDLIRQYFEEGYMVLENFFTKEELDPCRRATEKLVDDLAKKLFDAGKITDLYENYGLFQRLTKIDEAYAGASVILHKVSDIPDAYKHLWSNERLLNVIEQLIGPDVAGNAVWVLRTKIPQNDNSTVPWHQDSGYYDNNSYKAHVVTAWIPLLDANETNGCLQFLARGHRSGKIATHLCCWKDTWYSWIEEKEMEQKLGVDMKKDIVTVPVQYGGLVLFNNLIPHRSLPNLSNEIRWSLDLRFQRSSDPDCNWGIKKPILMRKNDDSNYQIDWTEFNSVDRFSRPPDADPFSTILSGATMKKWPIVHMNRHVEHYLKHEGLTHTSFSS